MSTVGSEGRSYKSIDIHDLTALALIARRDREDFFSSHLDWAKAYEKRFLCSALCQGAAKHFCDFQTGINDFDVYSFFLNNPARRWYAKRLKTYDFGNAKFGQSIDAPTLVGRRVDCMGRAIDVNKGEGPVAALRRYLHEGRTTTAKLLAQKAVVLLEPTCGVVVWRSS